MAKPTRRLLGPIAVSALAVSTLAACGSGASGSDPGSSATDGPASNSAQQASGPVAITLTDNRCTAEPNTVRAGPTTFKVTNTNGAAVSEVELLLDERILGEKENLAPGFSGSFSLNLASGSYQIFCPGATTEYSDFSVTGESTAATDDTSALLKQGTVDYGQYVELQSGLLAKAVEPLVAAIKAGNLDAAREEYAVARPYYERVEPVAESFTSGKVNLDARIDARAGDVPESQWSGFHVIEKGLFEDNSTTGLKPVAEQLRSDVNQLRSLVKGLTYQPAELLNGAGGLLDEVSKTKITGEEERYSRIDLVDFQANVEGAEQAFANVEHGIEQVDPDLTATIAARFAAIDQLLAEYRDPKSLGGFVLYPELTSADKKKMSAAVHAVKEPLSDAAAKAAAAS